MAELGREKVVRLLLLCAVCLLAAVQVAKADQIDRDLKCMIEQGTIAEQSATPKCDAFKEAIACSERAAAGMEEKDVPSVQRDLSKAKTMSVKPDVYHQGKKAAAIRDLTKALEKKETAIDNAKKAAAAFKREAAAKGCQL